jgi:glycosyltransferase involved in cell wall biosynthesis
MMSEFTTGLFHQPKWPPFITGGGHDICIPIALNTLNVSSRRDENRRRRSRSINRQAPARRAWKTPARQMTTVAFSRNNKIAFIQGDFHPTHATVRDQLRRRFPDFEIVGFNIRQLLRRHPAFALMNMFHMVAAYGVGGLVRRRDPTDCFIQTPAAFRFIKRLLASSIHSSEFAFSFQTYSMWDGSVPGVPHFVYTDNTELATLGYPGFDRSRLIGPWWTALERTIYHAARIVFTMSSNVTRILLEQYDCPAEKVRCVYVGSNAPVSETYNNDLERYRQKVILFVGTVWKNKGGPELIEAFKQVLKRHPKAQLRIVGCSPRINVPNCHVIGRISLEAVRKEYENASLFCLPTWRESFGISYIEAMNTGLAVVGSDFGAMPDFIVNGENGYRVRPGDIGALAEVLIKMLESPQLLQRFGQCSALKARENYTWDKVGSRMKEGIESVIG